MKNGFAHKSLVLSGGVAVLLSAALAPINAASAADGNYHNRGYHQHHCRENQTPITIEPEPARIYPVKLQIKNLHARVRNAETGEPVPGRLIFFTTPDGETLATAYTNSHGVADSSTSIKAGTDTIFTILHGYYALHPGDCEYAAMRAHGSVLNVAV